MGRLFFFGYGSLMYPKGINGRGMKHVYDWDDLTPATLFGYQRGMYALAYYNSTYYGIMPAAGKQLNGILFPIFSEEDRIALLKNELSYEGKIHPEYGLVYDPTDVSDCIYPKPNGKVLTLVNPEDKSSKGDTQDWYLSHVYEGIQKWGKPFVKKFLSSGGMEPPGGAK